MQQVDRSRFNQLKGLHGEVFFAKGEPLFADVVGNAQMVYYITESDSAGVASLVGVNVGIGSSMRIYFDTNRAPVRVVTMDKPDMQTYPVDKLPEEMKKLPNFRWLSARRPKQPSDVFRW